MYQKNFNVIYSKDEQDLVQTDSCEQVDIGWTHDWSLDAAAITNLR